MHGVFHEELFVLFLHQEGRLADPVLCISGEVTMLAQETDTKKIISRLVMQKILQHEVCKFLDKKKYEDLGKIFLSGEPDKDLRLDFIITKSNVGDRYYQGIADLQLKWITDDVERLDSEGNVWKTYEFRMSTGVNSRWNMKTEEIVERAECMMGLASLVTELDALVGKQMQIQTLTNEQRVQREDQIRHKKICDQIASITKWNEPQLIRGLRKGGKSRGISRDHFVDIPPGNYEVTFNEGSRRSPIVKKYFFMIPQNPAYLVSVKRTE